MEKHSIPSLQITDRFGAQTAYASLRLPDALYLSRSLLKVAHRTV